LNFERITMNTVYARACSLLAIAIVVIALPFVFRRDRQQGDWRRGDPELIIISPHNEAIRYEFETAFSAWHQQRYGQPVRIDWRNIGGTTEIMRYLEAESMAAFKAWRKASGRPWPAGAEGLTLDRGFDAATPPDHAAERERWLLQHDLHAAFRGTDDPRAFGCGIDLFFGGGAYDHTAATGKGFTVQPWPPTQPPDEIVSAAGIERYPARAGGEVWRTDTFFGTALSTFGICSNPDRLRDLGIEKSPTAWTDLADPRYAGQIGVADPTKSGSIAKAFELIIHTECMKAVGNAGFADQASAFEARIRAAELPSGIMPPNVPAAYQQAVEAGWEAGIHLVRKISANARYFTDGAGKVPIDVSTGDAAAGIAIDFFGRYQAESTRDRHGRPRMQYITPIGGSGVSADPISLLRGAPHRELAVRFIRFTLSPEGQRLWTYRAGTPGGPVKFSLRRLPVRRDFYPAPEDPARHAVHLEHRRHSADPLDDPAVDPYALAAHFTYHPRWTAGHFNIHRDLIRAMGMDAAIELKAAWQAIHAHPDPARRARALALLERLPTRPEPLDWKSALTIASRHTRLDYMREWTLFYRQSYREARQSLTEEAP